MSELERLASQETLKQLLSQDDSCLISVASVKRALKQKSKTGHWILTDVEGDRVWHCNCSECDKDPQDYIGGSEDWWLIKSNLPKFCPSCGSRNEV